MTDSVYVCKRHPPLGELWAGLGSRADIQAKRCVLCMNQQLHSQLAQLTAHKNAAVELALARSGRIEELEMQLREYRERGY